jgi:hypothetical protein
MIKNLVRTVLSLAVMGSLIFVSVPTAHADFNHNLIMDDAVFSNSNSMSMGLINSFLNQFPTSCISTNNGFSSPDPTGYSPSTGYTYGGNVSGGQVIYDAALAYGLNPQVLIATLQKESSVVTGTASYHCQYINTAMGYGCPDSGSCPTNPATMSGFSKQVIHAAWLLRFGELRSLGNTGWNVQSSNYPQGGDHWDNSDDPPTCYGGPMTQGNLSRGCGQAVTFYDGYTTIDGSSVHMDSGATAALYWYTPHFSGNQNFINIFIGWFGATTSDSSNDTLSFVKLNDSSGNAKDAGYSSTSSYSTPIINAVTGYPAVSPNSGVVPLPRPDGDLTFVRLNYASGNVEEVSYSRQSGYTQITSHEITGYPDVATDGAVKVLYRPNGDLTFVRLNYASGNVEEVSYSGQSGYRQITSHEITGYPDVATDGSVVPLFRPDGDLSFIRLNYSSGNVEAVAYSGQSGYRQITRHDITAYPAAAPDGSVVPLYNR